MRLTRRRNLPEGLTLDKGERVLAVSGDTVATDAALHFQDGAGFTRLPWERVEQAVWKDGLLVVREVGGDRHTVHLTEPGSVPETVRERVTSTVVVSTHVKLPGGGVRIAARRPARGSGEPRWTLVFDPGLDPTDAGLLAQAEQAMEELRRQTGL
ncbi:hypothetical protein GCM10027176_06950 [Actinoallomurus bryophytorum]|uniref:Uncharacterized protein n=1 Tax=Actinoallomurus bryophytorum TaxID=1490222 RepID=A0A543CCQ4_9ACTN|nr:hypothetical protein [Actinoallomurus bryophytorum]TQL94873.1 hypothetical protein FB559_0358 [Actinoallomurus bryophytorum]